MISRFLRKIRSLFSSDEHGYKHLEEKRWLRIRSKDDVDIIDQEEVPDKVLEDHGIPLEKEEGDKNREKLYGEIPFDIARKSRHIDYPNQHPRDIAQHATDNTYVLSDILQDPSIVDCDTRTGVVEFMADVDSSWAHAADIHTIAPDADIDEPMGKWGEEIDADADGEADGEAADSGDTGDSSFSEATASTPDGVDVADNPGPATDINAYQGGANSSGSSGNSGGGSSSSSGSGDGGGINAGGDAGGGTGGGIN